MQTKDHFILAKHMAKKYGIDNTLYRWSFVLGNIMPDVNKLSYIQGYRELKRHAVEHKPEAWRLSHREKLTLNDRRCLVIGGHTAEGSQKYVNKKFARLYRKKRYNIVDYYGMGKMLHYVVDSFTHPHTMAFHDGFFSHVEFEERLHVICKKIMSQLMGIIKGKIPAISLGTLYRAYRSEKPDPYNDCMYIVTAYINCMNQLLGFS